MLVHHEYEHVRSRVEDLLGISPARLQRVIQVGAEARRSITSLHPNSYMGTAMWGEATAALRRELIPEGWKYDEAGQQPRTFNSDRQIVVLVQSGDDDTGLVDGKPKTKHPKGSATETKVRDNQLALFSTGSDDDLGGEDEDQSAELIEGTAVLETWVLLLAEVDGELRGELSRPRGFDSSGRVDRWFERVVLEAVPMVAEDFALDQEDRDDEQGEEGIKITWQD